MMMLSFVKKSAAIAGGRKLLSKKNIVPNFLVVNSLTRTYASEAAEIAKGIKEGTLEGVDPEACNRCGVCKKVYYEIIENRSIDELPPVCALKDDWIKKWMVNHESLYVYDPRSLDSSNDRDDEALERHARESIVIPDNPKDYTMMRCGVNCCAD